MECATCSTYLLRLGDYYYSSQIFKLSPTSLLVMILTYKVITESFPHLPEWSPPLDFGMYSLL